MYRNLSQEEIDALILNFLKNPVKYIALLNEIKKRNKCFKKNREGEDNG